MDGRPAVFRKPIAWIVFTLLAALSTVFAVRGFPGAFPIVTLDLRMDRASAIAQARELAEAHGWGPDGFRQAASFGLDSWTQSFVELEGGGKSAFTAMMRDGLYHPYTWSVRHFREGETTQTTVQFTPGGEPYGFRLRLPEDEPGATLDPDAARGIAESAAVGDWKVDLEDWELVEESREERTGGRIDHTFVYERAGPRLGEGRYRLQLGVGGDRFTELYRFVKVPEGFNRRYEEMRSANEAIGVGSGVAIVLLYLIGGCGVGLFFLLRQRWVLWKKAVLWGFFVSGLQALVALNQWPLSWMGYDTALSVTSFVLQRLTFIVAGFIGMGVVLSVSFMAAESLTRKAFPRQIQLWRIWRAPVAGSPPVLGYTVSGYLLIGIFMAYEVALYAFAHSRLGWWTPSDALFDPDVLATYVPWLTSIAVSLQAGFWEECLFRAVPLAGAALIGQRFGGRRWWIAGAMILQAVIFGAGHAAYATQPSYARVVELIIPAVGFGLIYLRWGLLPAIVLHFAFDVVWFALPLFVSEAPGVGVQRAFVIALTLVPLWVVLGARIRNRRWVEVDAGELNASWTPPPPRARTETPAAVERASGLTAPVRLGLVGLGAVAVVAWVVASDFVTESPALPVTRSQALDAARRGLAERGIELGDEWRVLGSVQAGVGQQDRFVWQEGGPELYREMLGHFLAPPRWTVRYARFEGDVAGRAEEYRLWVDASGEATRFRHTLPEAAPGATLEEEAARDLALDFIRDAQGFDPSAIEEVSAEPSKLPERTDWTFIYRDPGRIDVEGAEARIGVDIGGDEIVDTYRYIHLPEDWRRAERDRRAVTGIVESTTAGTLFLAIAAGVVIAIVMWSRRRFAVRAFLVMGALMFVVNAAEFANGWHTITAWFSTAQSFTLQAALAVIGGLLSFVVVALAIGMNLGFTCRLLPPVGSPAVGDRVAGAALGALVAGVTTVAATLGPSTVPTWGDFAPAGGVIPAVTGAAGPVSTFLTLTTIVLLLFVAVDRLSAGWTRRKVLAAGGMTVLGLVTAGAVGVESVPRWIVAGLVTGAVLIAIYVAVLRRSWVVLPTAVATFVILAAVRATVRGLYPGARAGAIVGVVAVAVLAAAWPRLFPGRDAQT